jgi:isoleucyl-tRNA synthetase
MRDLVLDELNVKELRFDDRESDLVELRVKPNFKSLGPRLGKNMQRAAGAIAALPLETVLAIEAGTPHALLVDGAAVTLGPEDVVVERREKEGLFVECAGPLAVALDPELTPDLVDEGLAREFVNRVQGLRKEAGLRITDRIRIRYATSAPELRRALEKHSSTIRAETLAETLAETPEPLAPGAGTAVDINGHAGTIHIDRT